MIEPMEHAEELRRLMHTAALSGPGFRRTRRVLGAEERAELVTRLKALGEEPPSYLIATTEWVDRPAKLFEAGDYPDKGVSVSAEDLAVLSQGFDAPVPVLIEHSESPIQLGFLTDVEPREGELYGTISLTKEADALVRQSGARGLSLGLSPDLRTIREVSLVRNPRVESAGLFSSVMFSGELAFEPPRTGRAPLFSEETISNWIRQGRILPSQAPFVRALLEAGDSVDFEGTRKPLRQLVMAMVERQPPHSLFGEIVPASNAEAADNLLLPEEAAFYRKHFPDVSLSDIAARR
jgi:hypothetical protein